MQILVIGMNHRTAPVEIREQFSLSDADLAKAVKTLQAQKSILEAALISTCNRLEAYVVADQEHTGRYYTKAFLADWFGVSQDRLAPLLDIHEEEACVNHLFRVACGLDSMILGETQILGQVRDSFFVAQEAGTTGTVFNHIFKQAVTLAKQAHTKTNIGENAVSVSYAAVELAKQIFSNLDGKQVLILGAGKMSELTARHLDAGGAAKVTVANRTRTRAQELAAHFNGEAIALDDIAPVLKKADIVISSTGAKDYVMEKEKMASAVQQRKGRPLFIVDIAVPRDIDPQIHDLDGVFLYDIDDLNGIVEANLAERRQEAAKVEKLLEKELAAYREWLDTLGVVPVISALRTKAIRIQTEVMQSIERKLPDLDEHEKKVLRKHTKSIVNQLLRDPVQNIKELASGVDGEESLRWFTSLFAIEEEVAREKEKQKGKEAAAQFSQDSSRSPSAIKAQDFPIHP